MSEIDKRILLETLITEREGMLAYNVERARHGDAPGYDEYQFHELATEMQKLVSPPSPPNGPEAEVRRLRTIIELAQEAVEKGWNPRWELECASNPPSPPAEVPEVERCEYCGWPIHDDPKDGCTRDNCSMRPRPPKREPLAEEKDKRIAELEAELKEARECQGVCAVRRKSVDAQCKGCPVIIKPSGDGKGGSADSTIRDGQAGERVQPPAMTPAPEAPEGKFLTLEQRKRMMDTLFVDTETLKIRVACPKFPKAIGKKPMNSCVGCTTECKAKGVLKDG